MSEYLSNDGTKRLVRKPNPCYDGSGWHTDCQDAACDCTHHQFDLPVPQGTGFSLVLHPCYKEESR